MSADLLDQLVSEENVENVVLLDQLDLLDPKVNVDREENLAPLVRQEEEVNQVWLANQELMGDQVNEVRLEDQAPLDLAELLEHKDLKGLKDPKEKVDNVENLELQALLEHLVSLHEHENFFMNCVTWSK